MDLRRRNKPAAADAEPVNINQHRDRLERMKAAANKEEESLEQYRLERQRRREARLQK
eukprot:m.1173225 g.1173225  ORF g.1173225 m.1173225 type:complete len:58 (+) comp24521_c0_seq1:1799-1972(+)